MKHWLMAAVAFLLCGSAAAQTPAGGRAIEAYQRANQLFEQNRLAESMAALDESLVADPKYVPALTLKAKIAMGANRFDVAGECLERAVAADPSSWYARFLFGFWYYLRDDWPRALAELNTAHRLNPGYARSPLYLALTYERLGDLEKAIAFSDEAVRLEEAAGKPGANSLLASGRLLQQAGRLADCDKVLNRALKLYPNSRDVHYEIGRLLLKKGDAKGAAAAGEEALRMPAEDITDVQIRYLLVRAYETAGEDGPAAQHAAAIRAAGAGAGK
jgi:tetratricopeptide (TPR) repeat protein